MDSCSLVANACIRVLVVPFGDVSISRFKHYFSNLCPLHTISLKQITPPPGYNSSSSVLEHLNWQDGVLRFNFVVQGEDNALITMEDDEDGEKVSWNRLQAHQSIMAVVGLCDCSSTPDLMTALRDFQDLVQKYAPSSVSRWCAFDMTEEQMNADDLGHLIQNGMDIFREEKMMDDGRSSYEIQMEIVLCNLCTTLLQQFETIIKDTMDEVTTLEATKTPSPSNSTSSSSSSGSSTGKKPSKLASTLRSRGSAYVEMLLHGASYPGDRASATVKNNESKQRKRKLGRLLAWIGGYCLLGGSPQDALNYYNQAIMNCQGGEDAAWQAAALEGSASALFLLHQEFKKTDQSISSNSAPASMKDQQPNVATRIMNSQQQQGGEKSPTSPVPALTLEGEKMELISDVKAALHKAASLYGTVEGLWPLEVQATFKLTNYMAACLPASEVRKQMHGILATLFRKAFVEYNNARTNPSRPTRVPSGLDQQAVEDYKLAYMEKQQHVIEQIFRSIFIRSAILFERYQYYRKSSFLMQYAAEHEMNWGNALMLLQLSAQRLGIEPLYTVGESSTDRTISAGRDSWTVTKLLMLQSLVEAAQNAGKSQLAIDYALQLLKLVPNDAHAQIELCEIIQACVSVGGFTCLSKTCCFPIVEKVELLDPPEALALHKRKIASMASPTGNNAGLFYSPFAKEEESSRRTSTSSSSSFHPTKKWVKNEISSILLTLSNPTAFPIRIDAIYLDVRPFERRHDEKPLTEEEEFPVECHRATRLLQPNEKNHKVTLSARPLEPGQYVVRGCVISALGLKSRHYFPSAFCVEVVPGMPCLSFAYRIPEHDDDVKKVDLFEGEIFGVECEINQTSDVRCTVCELISTVSFEPPSSIAYRGPSASMNPNYDSTNLETFIEQIKMDYGHIDDEGKSLSGASSVLDYLITSSTAVSSQKSKVLAAVKGLDDANTRVGDLLTQQEEQGLSLPIRFMLSVHAHLGCKVVSFQAKYSANELQMERRYKLQFDLSVEPALHLLYVDVYMQRQGHFVCIMDIKNFSEMVDFECTAFRKNEDRKSPQLISVVLKSMCTSRIVCEIEEEPNEATQDHESVLAWLDSKISLTWNCLKVPKRHGLVRIDGAQCKVAPNALHRLNSSCLVLHVDVDKENRKLVYKIANNAKEDKFENLNVNMCLQKGQVAESDLAWDGAISATINRLEPGQVFVQPLSYRVLAKNEEPHQPFVINMVLYVTEQGEKYHRAWSFPFQI